MKRAILFTAAVFFAVLLFVSCDADKTRFYTVTFNSNGGTAVRSQEVMADGYASEPKSPEKEHFDFLEWQKNGEKFDFEGTRITENITLDAVWVNKVYTVKFDANGGSDVPLECCSLKNSFTPVVNK